MAHPQNITGAELQTLREACCLSREELAQLTGVQARTIKHWENGRSGVPADVAEMVTTIDNMIEQAANQARQAIDHMQADHTPASTASPAPLLADIVLLRYQTDQHLHTYRPDMARLPAGVHGAIVARVRATVRGMTDGHGHAVPVRVVWMQPDIYEPWRAACQLPDTEATRSQWAAQQVQNQSTPHRADQPPA